MREEIEKEVLYDVRECIKIIEVRNETDFTQLETLSNHAIEDVAVYKDADIITITVFLYSLYKVVRTLNDTEYQTVIRLLRATQRALEQHNLGNYNRSIKALFSAVEKSNTQTREHLQTVMDAARIKKGTVLLSKGLSIGQAAGLMGLSNWDLQSYASKTTALEHDEKGVPASTRLNITLKIFGVKP
ncbi:TPA: hypothetical protein HA241_03245 [Candidatus Woesearchaeota archaeon]|nr:hypothetical protein [Candidatus Woesearchaeota archaeon]